MNSRKEKEDLEVVSIKELFKRTISSVFLISFALITNYLSGYYFLTAILLILLILMYEYYKLFDIKYFDFYFFINFSFIAICVLFTFYDLHFLIIIPFLLGISVSSSHKLNWKVGLSSFIYFAVPTCLAIYLNVHADNGLFLITWLFVIIWSSDIAGFIIGKIIKGPKLIKSISPNKTWSGFVSSLIFAGFSSVIYAYFFILTTHIYAFLIGAFVSLFSVMGDLFESYLKRINKKKDSSNLIPGHGGLLDRLDGFLFAIVLFWLITKF